MAKYEATHKTELMKRIGLVNTSFSKWKTSSLKPLIDILDATGGTATQVRDAINALPTDKKQKYSEALVWLRMTYPGLPAMQLTGGTGLGKRNAAQFLRTLALHERYAKDYTGEKAAALYAKGGWAPTAATASNFLGKSLEHYILETAGLGAVMIDVGDKVPQMDLVVDGASHLDHLNSTMRALAFKGAPLCVLHQKDSTVCAELATAANRCTTTYVKVPTGHMGGASQVFQDFVDRFTTVVVMGFDGDVCVGANVFGSPELRPDRTLIEPIITKANVVTSRAVLVGTTLTKVQEWSCLFGT